MYRIKEAIKIAGELNEEAKSLKRPTVSNWAREGVISGIVDYEFEETSGGRSGLYPDDLPVEIAVAAKLKKKYKLNLIAKARQNVKEIIKEKYGKNTFKIPKSLWPDMENEEGYFKMEGRLIPADIDWSYATEEKELLEKAANADSREKREEYVEQYNEIKYLAEAEKDYLKLYNKFRKEV